MLMFKKLFKIKIIEQISKVLLQWYEKYKYIKFEELRDEFYNYINLNCIDGFKRNYKFDLYEIDYANPFTKIAIEVDCCFTIGCDCCNYKGNELSKNYSLQKTKILENNGWVVLHFNEHEIINNYELKAEMIQALQNKRNYANKVKIQESFNNGKLKVKSMLNKNNIPLWVPVSAVLQHYTPFKKMYEVKTEIASIKVTADHSLFKWPNKDPVFAFELDPGDLIVGLPKNEFCGVKILSIIEIPSEEFTYDVSVPESENVVLDCGILVHNTYSISGVSLDIEKSSKYQSMKDEYINEYDKVVEAAKRSIKIIKGLRQMRYGVGISSALGPTSRPGVQSRANFISSGSGWI